MLSTLAFCFPITAYYRYIRMVFVDGKHFFRLFVGKFRIMHQGQASSRFALSGIDVKIRATQIIQNAAVKLTIIGTVKKIRVAA